MNISRINTTPQTSFKARIKVDPVAVEKMIDRASHASTLGGASSVVGSVSATSSMTTGSEVLGSAFSLQASGFNSSGIVPSYMKTVGSSLTPTTINPSQAHPSIAGSIFSTLGSWFSTIQTSIKVKDPS